MPNTVDLVLQLTRFDRDDDRFVSGLHAVRAVNTGQDDGLGQSDKELTFRGQDFQFKLCCHQTAPCARAFSMISSMVPTMENAVSGYLSSSPPRMASKLRMVSDSGT